MAVANSHHLHLEPHVLGYDLFRGLPGLWPHHGGGMSGLQGVAGGTAQEPGCACVCVYVSGAYVGAWGVCTRKRVSEHAQVPGPT